MMQLNAARTATELCRDDTTLPAPSRLDQTRMHVQLMASGANT